MSKEKVSEIRFKVTTDEKNIPKKIMWDADEKEQKGFTETKAVSIALWEHNDKNTLRVDFWTDEMPVLEMKGFVIDSLAGMSQMVLNATGDTYISQELNDLCDKLSKYIKEK